MFIFIYFRRRSIVKSIRKPFKKLIIGPFSDRTSRKGQFFFASSPQPCLTTLSFSQLVTNGGTRPERIAFFQSNAPSAFGHLWAAALVVLSRRKSPPSRLETFLETARYFRVCVRVTPLENGGRKRVETLIFQI